jgi:hypothetical protein
MVAWTDLLRRRRLYALSERVLWGSAIAIIFASSLLHIYFWPSPRVWWMPAILATLVAYYRMRAFRCPRCRKRWPKLGKPQWWRPNRSAAPTGNTCTGCKITIGTPKSAVLDAEKRVPDVTGAGA